MGREVADEEFEGGVGVEAGLQIACSHGEFVEVGEQAGVLGDESRLHGSVPGRVLDDKRTRSAFSEPSETASQLDAEARCRMRAG